MNNKTTNILMILFAAVIICLFIAAALYMIFKDYGYATVEGIVIEIKSHEDDEQTFYSPIVKFDYEGKTYVASPSVSGSDINHNVGDRIVIRVNPDNPEQISVSTERSIGYSILIFVAFICVIPLNFCVLVPRLKAKYRDYNWGGISMSIVFIIFPFLVFTVTYLFSGEININAFFNQKPFLLGFLAFSALGIIAFIYELIKSLKIKIYKRRSPDKYDDLIAKESARLGAYDDYDDDLQ